MNRSRVVCMGQLVDTVRNHTYSLVTTIVYTEYLAVTVIALTGSHCEHGEFYSTLTLYYRVIINQKSTFS